MKVKYTEHYPEDIPADLLGEIVSYPPHTLAPDPNQAELDLRPDGTPRPVDERFRLLEGQ